MQIGRGEEAGLEETRIGVRRGEGKAISEVMTAKNVQMNSIGNKFMNETSHLLHFTAEYG